MARLCSLRCAVSLSTSVGCAEAPVRSSTEPARDLAQARQAFCAEVALMAEQDAQWRAAVPRREADAVKRDVIALLAERGFTATRDAGGTLLAHHIDEHGYRVWEVQFSSGAQFVEKVCVDRVDPSTVIQLEATPMETTELKQAWMERFQPDDARRIANLAPVTSGPVFDRCLSGDQAPHPMPDAEETALPACPPPPGTLAR